MQVFIDESGIHKQDGQSTTAVVYVKVEDVEGLDKIILRTEKYLRIDPFHWRGESWKIRRAFLQAVVRENFEVKIFVFQNPFTGEKFENALRHLLVEKGIRNIILDGDKLQRNVARLKKVLRDSGTSVKKIRMGNDQSFPCLRLADLFAGLTRAYFEDSKNKKAAELYYLAKIKIATQLMGGQVAG